MAEKQRWIMHIDMDAFYASVEQHDNPELRGKPVIVGGQSMRGVVSTCSYEARRFGVHSAMPTVQAHRLCPDGIYVPCRMSRYQEVSRQIMGIFHELSPLVEQLSVDEAFLDVSGMELLYGRVEDIGWLAKERIKERTGLTASVGLAPNKFLAKLASDLQKPDGFTVITPAQAREFIAPMPVTKIFGIGKAAAEQLLQFGVERIGQLAQADAHVLQRVFGKNAERVRRLALGLDERPVVGESEPKSIGREETFEEDLHSKEECKKALLQLSGLVGYRLRRKGYFGRTLTLKVKYADFHVVTRSMSGESDLVYDEDIYALAVRLLEQVKLGGGVRLLGLAVSGLGSGEPLGLAFEEDQRRQRRNAAADALKARFGEKIIFRGGVGNTYDGR